LGGDSHTRWGVPSLRRSNNPFGRTVRTPKTSIWYGLSFGHHKLMEYQAPSWCVRVALKGTVDQGAWRDRHSHFTPAQIILRPVSPVPALSGSMTCTKRPHGPSRAICYRAARLAASNSSIAGPLVRGGVARQTRVPCV
jgi:hypothetical protein